MVVIKQARVNAISGDGKIAVTSNRYGNATSYLWGGEGVLRFDGGKVYAMNEDGRR